MNRHFKKIEEFEDYYISINGIVFSKKSNKYIKTNKYVTLIKNDKKYTRSIKKLINVTFYEVDDVDEKYKKINGFESYLIDKYGNVYSKYTKTLKKGFINSSGYNCIFLSKKGKLYNKLIHRLVYETWKGKIKKNMTVDHIDENKNNNYLDNLQLLTRSDNVLKFHEKRTKSRNIEGFLKINNFDNYYINNKGEVISYKYGEECHQISTKNGEIYLRKNNKRYYLNVNKLLYEYFGENFIIKENRNFFN